MLMTTLLQYLPNSRTTLPSCVGAVGIANRWTRLNGNVLFGHKKEKAVMKVVRMEHTLNGRTVVDA